MNKIYLKILYVLAPLLIIYIFTINYISQYEIGIGWNSFSGKYIYQEKAGLYITPPWVQISSIDIRPQRVCITTTAKTLNCKLVQFNKKEYKEFLKLEGFRYYWLSNRFSYNNGYIEEYRGMRDILRGYAFSSKQYPFLKY